MNQWMYDKLTHNGFLSDSMNDAVDQCICPNILEKLSACASTRTLTT